MVFKEWRVLKIIFMFVGVILFVFNFVCKLVMINFEGLKYLLLLFKLIFEIKGKIEVSVLMGFWYFFG